MPKSSENATAGSKLVANNKFAFTERRIEKLPNPQSDQRSYFYDTVVRGLCIAVSPLGKKTYVLYRKVNGRPERVTIGPVSDMTIEAARGEASRMNGLIAQGANPAAERRAVRAEMTLKELFDTYQTLYSKERLRESTWKNYESIFKHLPAGWHLRKLSQISRQDVVALHAKIGRTRGQHAANRTIELLCAMWSRAQKDWGYEGPNPAAKIEAFKETERERFLGDADPKEPARFFAALGKESQLWQDFFKVCVLTGARCSNVESMAWTEIDWKRQQWTIPADNAKEGDALHVVLSQDVVDVLESRKNNGSTWVFPSPRKKLSHIVESKSAWSRILEAAKIENLRVHDLRRTFGSYQVAGGASLAMVGKALGHADGSSATKIYGRLNLDPIRASVGKATAAILAAADPKMLEAKNTD
ncbi:MAG: tyrosine-type recombinase/integrase [Candidatus Sulfotelmatobacter sp.]